MAATTYDPDATMLDARTRYFELNDFGPDGGYSSKWVHIELGPIPLRFPNTPARVRAVRYHDLHHVLTGYGTDMPGEAEIAAWELASNCRSFYAAWILNGGALAYGLLICPRRVRAAFIRGRHSRNLYDRDFDDTLLGRTVADLRAELGLDRDTPEHPQPACSDRRRASHALPAPRPAASIRDRLAFAAAAVLALGVPLGLLAVVIVAVIALLS